MTGLDDLHPSDFNVTHQPGGPMILTIDDTEYQLDRTTANKFHSAIATDLDYIDSSRDSPTLTVTRKRNTLNHPWHINNQFGCQHSGEIDGLDTQLNLATMTHTPEYDRWTGNWRRGQRDSPMSIDRYLEEFMCTRCLSAVAFWHTQRRIFLPMLADQLTLNEVDCTDFTTNAAVIGACNACGTPDSGAFSIDSADDRLDVQVGYRLCPTCRDLLIDAESTLRFDRLQPTQHPHATDTYTPQEPVTDPDHTPEPSTDTAAGTDSEADRLDKPTFVSTVSSFDGVTTKTAEKLFNDGYRSVAELAFVTKRGPPEITLVGNGTADRNRDAATDALK